MMQKKVYTLKTCSTCQRILKDVGVDDSYEIQNIKTTPITEEQLDQMAKLSGSYESLFSRRSMQYKALGLKDKTLNESDFKNYILSEYTFLKRPVFIFDQHIFVGNSSKTIEDIKKHLIHD